MFSESGFLIFNVIYSVVRHVCCNCAEKLLKKFFVSNFKKIIFKIQFLLWIEEFKLILFLTLICIFIIDFFFRFPAVNCACKWHF